MIVKLLNKLRDAEKIADINYCDEKGYIALHLTAKYNQYDSMHMILNTEEADINILTQNEEKYTPLQIATIEQQMILVKMLL